MFNKMSLKLKIVIPTIILITIGVVVLGFLLLSSHENTANDLSKKYMSEMGNHYAELMGGRIDYNFGTAKMLALAVKDMKEDGVSREDLMDYFVDVLNMDLNIFGIYTAWEENAFDNKDKTYIDSDYHDSTGRYIPYVYRGNDGIAIEALVDYEESEYYKGPKETKKTIITNPYEYETNSGVIYIASISIPIIIDGDFVGIVGIDVEMSEMIEFINNTTIYDSGYVYFVNNDGTFILHKDENFIGKSLTDALDIQTAMSVENALKTSKSISFSFERGENHREYESTMISVKLGESNNNWGIGFTVPRDEIRKPITNGYIQGIIVSLIVLLVTSFMLILLISKMVGKINMISLHLNQSSDNVSAASSQLSVTSQDLAEGSSEQAASIEETSASMEQTAAMVKQNASNTKVASSLSLETKNAANEGAKKMEEMILSMEELEKSSNQISKIIKVIDDIAFQTNILALNAAVEAARAGDAGQGFAVVAEEVRNLAQRSANAAKDTQDIIEKNIDLTSQGTQTSKKVNESLLHITNSVEKVTQLVQEIEAASNEQNKGVTQVAMTMNNMEVVVQKNASAAEESAASAEELQAQADELLRVSKDLRVIILGEKKSKVEKRGENRKKNKSYTYMKEIKSTKIDDDPEDVLPLGDDEF